MAANTESVRPNMPPLSPKLKEKSSPDSSQVCLFPSRSSNSTSRSLDPLSSSVSDNGPTFPPNKFNYSALLKRMIMHNSTVVNKMSKNRRTITAFSVERIVAAETLQRFFRIYFARSQIRKTERLTSVSPTPFPTLQVRAAMARLGDDDTWMFPKSSRIYCCLTTK